MLRSFQKNILNSKDWQNYYILRQFYPNFIIHDYKKSYEKNLEVDKYRRQFKKPTTDSGFDTSLNPVFNLDSVSEAEASLQQILNIVV